MFALIPAGFHVQIRDRIRSPRLSVVSEDLITLTTGNKKQPTSRNSHAITALSRVRYVRSRVTWGLCGRKLGRLAMVVDGFTSLHMYNTYVEPAR